MRPSVSVVPSHLPQPQWKRCLKQKRRWTARGHDGLSTKRQETVELNNKKEESLEWRRRGAFGRGGCGPQWEQEQLGPWAIPAAPQPLLPAHLLTAKLAYFQEEARECLSKETKQAGGWLGCRRWWWHQSVSGSPQPEGPRPCPLLQPSNLSGNSSPPQTYSHHPLLSPTPYHTHSLSPSSMPGLGKARGKQTSVCYSRRAPLRSIDPASCSHVSQGNVLGILRTPRSWREKLWWANKTPDPRR